MFVYFGFEIKSNTFLHFSNSLLNARRGNKRQSESRHLIIYFSIVQLILVFSERSNLRRDNGKTFYDRKTHRLAQRSTERVGAQLTSRKKWLYRYFNLTLWKIGVINMEVHENTKFFVKNGSFEERILQRHVWV